MVARSSADLPVPTEKGSSGQRALYTDAMLAGTLGPGRIPLGILLENDGSRVSSLAVSQGSKERNLPNVCWTSNDVHSLPRMAWRSPSATSSSVSPS